ncbi:MAG TPA: glycosyltransferase family protein [bacterium]|nr:glycosyltransferase family protein [bacterium]
MVEGPRNKRILFAILNWGLGHATRSIPLIKALSRQNEVIIASTGRSLELLKQEFPDHSFIDFPDYGSHYSKFGFLLIPYLGLQIPVILWRLFRERRKTERYVEEHNIDFLISDSRFGVYSKEVPSYFITHQLRFPLPRLLQWMSPMSEWYNRYFFNQYDKIFVVDVKDSPNLSKDLSHTGKIADHDGLVYIGALSSIPPRETTEDIDVLVTISGPESARTLFEETILSQIKDIEGRKVVILGKPDEPSHLQNGSDLEIFNHVSRERMTDLMNRSRLIVCRSGYSTVMELVALSKPALLVPTPGQTEQQYLAEYYDKSNMFRVARQKSLNLREEIARARHSNGYMLPRIPVNDIDKFLRNLSE